jgi:hypothetical protein
MGWREDYISLLQGFGVDVEIRPGWMQQSAGRGNWQLGQPVGQINHHFVNPYTSADLGLVQMIERGYSGGPQPFIVNDFLGRDGKLFLISSYPTGHPGKGSRQVLNRVRLGQAPLGDAAAVGMANDLPQNEAERAYYGVEVSSPGDGTPLRPGQYRTLVARNAALALACRLSANASIQHREHTDRKQDIHRNAVNANQLRADVAALMGGKRPNDIGGSPTLKPQTSEKDWDEMASQAEISAIVQKALENPDNMRAAAKTLLAYDIGTGKSLAATLQEIVGQQQQIIAALNAPKG